MATLIYHEKQAAALCGRHALNNLLQVCTSKEKKKFLSCGPDEKIFLFFFIFFLIVSYREDM